MPKGLSKKQIIIIAGIILFLIILAIVLTVINKNRGGLNLKTTAPSALVKSSISFPVLSANGEKIYYLDKLDKVFKSYEITNKKTTNLLDSKFDGAYNVFWNTSKDKVIVSSSKKETEDKYNFSYTVINFVTKETKTLDLPLSGNFYWSNQNDQIIYSVANVDDYNFDDIFTANADGTNSKKITQIKDFGAPLSFNWKTTNNIEIFKPFFNPPETSLSDTEQNAFLISFNLSTNMTSPKKIDADTVDISFSPYGEFFAMRKDVAYQSFQIEDQKGVHEIKVAMDTANSLAWSQDNKLLISFTVANDGKAVDIYKIDLNDFSSKQITEFRVGKTAIDIISNCFIYQIGKYLFFNANDTLYGIKTDL